MKLVTNWWRYDPIPTTNITRQYKIHRGAVRTTENEKNVSVEMNKRVICIVTYSAYWCKDQWNWPRIDGDMIKYRQQTSHDNTKSIVVRYVQRRLRHTVSVEMNKMVICIVTYSAYWWNKQWNWLRNDGDMIKCRRRPSRHNMLVVLSEGEECG
jgi:hypothetical protein